MEYYDAEWGPKFVVIELHMAHRVLNFRLMNLLMSQPVLCPIGRPKSPAEDHSSGAWPLACSTFPGDACTPLAAFLCVFLS